jgi:hypothetical protein
LTGAVLVASALMTPRVSQARSWEVRDFSNGEFEIEFSNGCTVTYSRHGNREDQTRNCKNKQLRSADETARSHRNSYDDWYGDSVPESQMRKYCQGEASAELGVRPTHISTDDVERRNNKYIVRGESRTGSDFTTFKCTFDKHGVFQRVDVNGPSNSGNSVPQGQMRKYCQGEASAKLDVRPNHIATDDAYRRGGKYIVRGQTPKSGSNVTTFECTFDRDGVFQHVDVKRSADDSGYESGNSGDIPNSARRKCTDRFGNSPRVTSVSALRPGYWEVIMQARKGPRSVPCTVTGSGRIENWVELN